MVLDLFDDATEEAVTCCRDGAFYEDGEWIDCKCPKCECPCEYCQNCEDCAEQRRPRRRNISKREKEALYAEQKGRCMYCGIEQEIERFDGDHKTPLKKGGSNHFSNYQLLCGPCNRRKGGDLTDGEFRDRFKLTRARQAKGPPTPAIPLTYFQKIAKEIASKKTTKRKAQRRRVAEETTCCGSTNVWEDEFGEWEIKCGCPECECPCEECAECVKCYRPIL